MLAFQVKMLRGRIDDSRIHTMPEERAELIRLGERIDHDIAGVMQGIKGEIKREQRLSGSISWYYRAAA